MDSASDLFRMIDISVILCTYNGRSRLRPTLEHLALQETSLQWELILVDNASTDGTAAYVRSQWEELHPSASLRIITECRPGLVYARIAGVKACRSKYIIFCDDDNWLREDYLQTAYELMEQMPNVGVLGGQGALAPYIEAPIWWKGNECNYAAGKQMQKTGIANERGFLSGAGMVTRTELAWKVFDDRYPFLLTGRKGNQTLSGEDWEYCIRVMMVGYDLYYREDLFYWHDVDASRLTGEYLNKLLNSFELGTSIYEKYKYALSYQRESFLGNVLKLHIRVWKYLTASSVSIKRKRDLLYMHAYMMGLLFEPDRDFNIIKGFSHYAKK